MMNMMKIQKNRIKFIYFHFDTTTILPNIAICL